MTKYTSSQTIDKNKNIVIIPMLICIVLGIIYSMQLSSVISFLSGMVATIVICYCVLKFNIENSFILIFGTQFLRAVIKLNLGSHDLSFLLFALPIFILKYLYVKEGKITIRFFVPFLLFIIDIVSSVVYDTISIGDQLLWVQAFLILIILTDEKQNINMNNLILIFCLSIWGICLVNIIYEINTFGRSLIPSMYGTWNSYNIYYTFGLGYADIAGGNEISQYIPIFCATALFSYKSYDKKSRLFLLLSAIFFIYCGMLCIARAFYVEMLILVILYILSRVKHPVYLLSGISVFFIGIYYIYANYHELLKTLIDAVLIRFEGGNNVRTQLIVDSLKLWKESLYSALFGRGTQYGKLYGVAHNILIDSFVSLGIVGSTLYLSTIIGTFARSPRKSILKSLDNYTPLIMFLAFKMISGGVLDIPFYFLIIFTLFFLNYDIEDRKKLYEYND